VFWKDANERKKMFAVQVKKKHRKSATNPGFIWIKDATYEFYVTIKERGVWPTKEEAKQMITGPWEIVVEVNK